MTVFTEYQKDILEYIIKLSTNNSARALSEMTEGSVSLEAPKLELISINDIANIVGGSEALVTTVNLLFEGDVPGLISLIFSEQSAFNLVDILIGNKVGTTTKLDEMGESALGEVGNIVVSHFLKTLGTHAWMQLQPSTPMVVTDMAGAILSAAVLSIGGAPEEILFARTVFSDKKRDIESNLLLFVAPTVLKKILEIIEARR